MSSPDMLAQLVILAEAMAAELATTRHRLTAGLVCDLVASFVAPGGRFLPAGALFSAYHFADCIRGNSAAGVELCALAVRLATIHGIALNRPFPVAGIFRQTGA